MVLSNNTVATGDRYQCISAVWDLGLQLRFHRARVTNGAAWLQEDPKGFDAGDANVRRVVGNAPTNGLDPSGLAPPQANLQSPYPARDPSPAASETTQILGRSSYGKLRIREGTADAGDVLSSYGRHSEQRFTEIRSMANEAINRVITASFLIENHYESIRDVANALAADPKTKEREKLSLAFSELDRSKLYFRAVFNKALNSLTSSDTLVDIVTAYRDDNNGDRIAGIQAIPILRINLDGNIYITREFFKQHESNRFGKEFGIEQSTQTLVHELGRLYADQRKDGTMRNADWTTVADGDVARWDMIVQQVYKYREEIRARTIQRTIQKEEADKRELERWQNLQKKQQERWNSIG